MELFTVMIWLSFLGGCDVQQEGNWKSIICKYNERYMYIGNGKITK